MNGTGGFAADDFHDARMRMAKSVHGDAAKKIEILFAGGIENICAAAVSHHLRLALVSRQKKLFSIQQTRVRFCVFRRSMFELAHGADRELLFGRGAHHTAESAACAADKRSRRTRVPGIKRAPS